MALLPDVTEILDDPEVGGGVSFAIRRPAQTRTRGSVSLEYEEISATGNIQPVSKGANQSAPEDALDEQIVIRTVTTLQEGGRSGGVTLGADEIIYSGKRWRVTRVENWVDWGFVTAYATRVREG